MSKECEEMKNDGITERVRIEVLRSGSIKVRENVSIYKAISILEKLKFAILSESDKIEEIERVILDFENPEPFICIAHNKKTGHFQLSINDIEEPYDLGFIEVGKTILIKSLLGELSAPGAEEKLRQMKELLG